MKGKIYLYLFVFALLLVIFQYVNSKNILESYEKKFDKYEAKIEAYKDSIQVLEDKNFELSIFGIDRNEDALSYFERDGYNVSELIPLIKDGLIRQNEYEGDDHPIVPYVSMTGNKMLINQIKILNHKWRIANFTDGKHWGEILITYEIDENQQLKYKLAEYFMYPPQSY